MIRNLTLAIASVLALAAPAQALTLQQAQAELAGMYCSGSSCTSEATSTAVRELEDIQVYGSPVDLNTPGGATNCFTGSIIDGPFADGERCTPAYTLAPGNGGYIIDGGTATDVNCTVTTKTLTYNGPFTSRDTAWSVDTSTSTSGGAC